MTKTKISLILMFAGAVVFTVVFWLYSTMENIGTLEYSVAGLVLVVVSISVGAAMKRIKAEKKGLTIEDELSRRIRQKAAANAFALSFYQWTLIAIFSINSNIGVVIPIGVLGMGLIFVGYWIYYSKTGIKDENAH